MTRSIIIKFTFFLLFLNVGICQITFDEKETIKTVIFTQQESWDKADIDGYMAGYWKSDSLLFTSGGNVQRGWQATYEKYKKSYNSKEEMGKLVFSDIEVNLLSPESAWVFGRWELKREKDNPKGVFTLIFKKFNDEWKIIHDHTSIQNSK